MLITRLEISGGAETYSFHRLVLGPQPDVRPLQPMPRIDRLVDPYQVARVRERVVQTAPGQERPTRAQVLEIGRAIDRHLLPPAIRTALRTTETDFMIVTDDPGMPWELAGVVGEGEDATCLGERAVVARSLLTSPAPDVQTPPTCPPTESTHQQAGLIIADPTDGLPEAQREASVLAESLTAMGWQIDLMCGRVASYDEVYNALESQRYAFVHYSGHVDSDRTGGTLRLSDAHMPAFTVANMECGATLVFLNACGSAITTEGAGQTAELAAFVAGVAQGFMASGVPSVIGALWAVEDLTARVFAERFYGALTEGTSVGRAMLAAKALATGGVPTAADHGALDAATLAGYVIYGDPSLSIAPPGTPVDPPKRPGRRVCRSEWFDTQCGLVVARAAGVADTGGGALTSAHLVWAILVNRPSPLGEWLTTNGLPLSKAARLLEGLVVHSDAEQPQPGEEIDLPPLSKTIERLWDWMEAQPRGEPITLEALTLELVKLGGGVTADLLAGIGIDLTRYPNRVTQALPLAEALPLSDQARRALQIAQSDARTTGGLVSSTHLLLGTLEVGDNSLCERLLQSGLTADSVVQRIRRKLPRNDELSATGQETLSANVVRILRAAAQIAKDAETSEIGIEQILAAAVTLKAGQMGRVLASLGYESPARGRDSVPTARTPLLGDAAEFDGLAEDDLGLLKQAALVAVRCGHAQVGTPHVAAAALRTHEAFRSAVRHMGRDPDLLAAEMEAELGAADSGVTNGPADGAPPALPLSANLSATVERVQRAAFESSGSPPLGAAGLLPGVLSQAGGYATRMLQARGVEPYALLRHLESEQ